MSFDPRAVLLRAHQSGAPFHVISLFREARHEARLEAVEEDELTFRISGEHGLAPQDAVSVLFSTGPRTYSFMARVGDVDGEQLWVPFPEDLLSADRRIRPRLAVIVPTSVTFVSLPDDTAVGPWQLVDISPTGMRLRPAIEADVGTLLNATLHAGEHHVNVRAELRHIHGDVAGFYFHGSVQRGRVLPLPGLTDLIGDITAAPADEA